jgi:hypothetical protein
MTVQKGLTTAAAAKSSKASTGRAELAGQRATRGPAVHFHATPTKPQTERTPAAINAELNLPSQSAIRFIKPDRCFVSTGN